MSIWDTQPYFSTWNPDVTKVETEYLSMSWTDAGTTVEATVRKVGSALRATEIKLVNQDGIPSAARRLPSDGQIVQHLRDAGNEGISAIIALLDDMDALSDGLELVRRGEVPRSQRSDLEAALEGYVKEFNKRPRVRIDEQTRRAAEWLTRGWSTTQIIEELRSQGLSKRTAFRRLEAARSLGADADTGESADVSND